MAGLPFKLTSVLTSGLDSTAADMGLYKARDPERT